MEVRILFTADIDKQEKKMPKQQLAKGQALTLKSSF